MNNKRPVCAEIGNQECFRGSINAFRVRLTHRTQYENGRHTGKTLALPEEWKDSIEVPE